MSEELNIVRDLAVILISAGVFTIISKALKQPLILGYILAGFLIGPNVTFFPGITNEATMHQWSEIGIIFLMFGLGLEFSFKKLLKVGVSAIVTAAVKFVGVFIIGFVTAQALSWSFMESVFLGGLLSMSSTMVVLKSYDDLGLKNKPYAGVGCTLGVMRDFIYPVIIAVSVITTFTTPFMIKLATPCYNLLNKRLPPSWINRLRQTDDSSGRHTAAESSEWKSLLNAYFTRIILYGVIIIAIYIGSKLYLRPAVARFLPELGVNVQKMIEVGITLIVMVPFLFGLGVHTGSISMSAPKLLKEKPSNIWPLIGLILARSFLAVGIVLGVLSSYFELAGWTVLAILIAGIIFILFARRSLHKYSALEMRFLSNYNEKEENERRSKPIASSVSQKLADYDVHTETMTLSPNSTYAGKALKDIPFRARTGANIIKIARGSLNIIVPSGDEVLFPGDRMLAIGTTAQLESLRNMLDSAIIPESATMRSGWGFRIVPEVLTEDSFLTGKTLRGINLRKYHCMVISVLRDNDFITNPEPDFRFRAGDTVWIAGNLAELETV